MTLTQVREAPHVTETNAESYTGENVLRLVVPFGSVPDLLLLQLLQLLIRRNPIIQARVWEYQFHGYWLCQERTRVRAGINYSKYAQFNQVAHWSVAISQPP